MAGDEYPARVVREVSGAGTGDRILIDEHGRRWLLVDHLPSEPRTGQSNGRTDGRTVWRPVTHPLRRDRAASRARVGYRGAAPGRAFVRFRWRWRRFWTAAPSWNVTITGIRSTP